MIVKSTAAAATAARATPCTGWGLIGAAIYFIGTATTFWMGVLGFLKAIVWPVFLVLEAFKALLGA